MLHPSPAKIGLCNAANGNRCRLLPSHPRQRGSVSATDPCYFDATPLDAAAVSNRAWNVTARLFPLQTDSFGFPVMLFPGDSNAPIRHGRLETRTRYYSLVCMYTGSASRGGRGRIGAAQWGAGASLQGSRQQSYLRNVALEDEGYSQLQALTESLTLSADNRATLAARLETVACTTVLEVSRQQSYPRNRIERLEISNRLEISAAVRAGKLTINRPYRATLATGPRNSRSSANFGLHRHVTKRAGCNLGGVEVADSATSGFAVVSHTPTAQTGRAATPPSGFPDGGTV